MSIFCVSQNGAQVITLLNSLALFLYANSDFLCLSLCRAQNSAESTFIDEQMSSGVKETILMRKQRGVVIISAFC